MTAQERLEWALKHWSDLPELKCNFCGKVFRGDHECDYEYLKKRVQELENEIKTHAPHGRNYTNEQVVKIRMQNKRYQEALEFYADKRSYSDVISDEWGSATPILQDRGYKAREELEESK